MNPTLSLSRVSGILITLAAAIIILAGIQAASSILGPFLLSVYLTLIFGTLLHWFESKGLSTRLALVLTLVIFYAIIAVFIVTIAGSFIQAMSDLPGYLEKLDESIESASPFLISIGIDPAILTFENLIQTFSAAWIVLNESTAMARVCEPELQVNRFAGDQPAWAVWIKKKTPRIATIRLPRFISPSLMEQAYQEVPGKPAGSSPALS